MIGKSAKRASGDDLVLYRKDLSETAKLANFVVLAIIEGA
jgi:hypothetical protein